MSAPPYMKLFWGDYHRDTRHLTRDEHGAYFLLLGETWNRGGVLPDDDLMLSRWALSTPDEWARLKPVVMAFFTLGRGGWKHKRVAEELAAYTEVSRKRKIAGKTGGSASPRKGTENPEAIAKQKPTKPEPESDIDNPPTPLTGGADGKLFGDKAAPKPERKKPKRSIPKGFPDAEAIEAQQVRAREAGADIDVAYQAQRFSGWAMAKDQKFADWPQAWRNWMGRAIHEAPKFKLPLSRPAESALSLDDQWRKRIRDWQQHGHWDEYEWGRRPKHPSTDVPAHILAEFGIAPLRAVGEG